MHPNGFGAILMEIAQNHYVYEWVRPDYNVAFYVGKGSGDRAWDFKRNKRTKKIIDYLVKNGLAPQVRILARFLTKESAFDFEIERIAFWRDLGELANQTRGGEGLSSEMAREIFLRPEVRAKSIEGVRRYSKTPEAKAQYANNVDKREGRGWNYRGQGNLSAKLTEQQVREILYSTDTNKALSDKYGVCADQISSIRRRECWAHIDAPDRPVDEWKAKANQSRGSVGSKNGSAKITEEDVIKIITSTEKNSVLARGFGLNSDYVADIRKGRVWKHIHERLKNNG